MKRKYLSRENICFYAILLTAASLRFYNYYYCSFSHDELSAIVRLNYDSFSQLFSEGIHPDGHPAFVQSLLYFWTKLFGFSEAAVRFPFVLAGIGSVALVYWIAKKWFGFTSACFSSLALAVLGFPVLYSQLARPYSFGLFFSLLGVLCWTNLLFGSGKRIYFKALLYGTVTVLCMLTHYFSFLLAVLVAVSGLFFLKKDTWKPYLLSGIVACILFLPHLAISLHQFSVRGVGQWLGKPEGDYLWKFILYAFNDSPIVVITAAIIFLLSILIYHTEFSFYKFHFICLAWFLIPFFTGYYYSLNINPVLQYSTLLFSFPFLLIFIFSFFKESAVKFNNGLLITGGIILSYSILIEQRFYKREHFAVFKEINQAVVNLHKQYGVENITTILNTSDKRIMDFYFKQWHDDIQYDFYEGDNLSFVPDILRKIDSCATPYVLYGWSNFRNPYEIPELIKRKFPCMIYDEKHFNSQITLFARNDSCNRDTIFYIRTDFEPASFLKKEMKYVSFDSTRTDSSRFYTGNYSLKINPANEFCITYKTTVKELFVDNAGCVNISARIYAENMFNAQIVMEVGDPKGKKDWQAKPLPQFVSNVKQWNEVFASIELPSTAYPEDEVLIYLWNNDKHSFYLDDFTISSFADSYYNYYQTSYRK